MADRLGFLFSWPVGHGLNKTEHCGQYEPLGVRHDMSGVNAFFASSCTGDLFGFDFTWSVNSSVTVICVVNQIVLSTESEAEPFSSRFVEGADRDFPESHRGLAGGWRSVVVQRRFETDAAEIPDFPRPLS